MNNEPVAWMDYLEHSDVYDLNVSGRGIPLYTHPAKTLTEIIEKNKPEIEKANAYIKSLKDEIEALKTKEQKDYEIISDLLERNVALKSKTLTDEEIIEVWCGMETDTGEQNIAFARAILKKAQEK